MEIIKKLPQQIVNQIAAGEVVERPASIIKELIENSLDAGAKHIEVTLKDGGLTEITIKDDGKGISKADLPAAVERFSTSKLEDISDLETIATYGFRGEALASISAVSNVKIISRTDESDAAYSLTVAHGQVSGIVPCSRGIGTTIEISELFNQIPARQKFLKSKETEFKYIVEVFQNFALVRPDVHFVLINDGKTVYDLPPEETDLLMPGIERMAQILRIEAPQVSQVKHNEFGTTVTGYILNPKFMNETSRFVRLFVNGRPVEDRGIFRSLQKGISEYVPHTFKPSAVINLNIDQSQLDVNVHPRKIEVKFLNPFRVYSTVENAIIQALKNVVSEEMGIPAQLLPKSSSLSRNISDTWDKQNERAYDRLRGTSQSSSYEYQPQLGNMNEQSFEDSGNESGFKSEFSQQKNGKTEITRTASSQTLQHVYSVLGRYIIAEWESEIWIVDQHAAAERIRFERLKRAYLFGDKLPQQNLLIPMEIKLSVQEVEVVKLYGGIFTKLGFTHTLNDNSMLISAVPTFLQQGDIERIIRESIAELTEIDNIGVFPDVSDFSSTKDISLVIATMACHNSIRMNEKVSVTDAKSLVDDLLKCEIPYACPHGRRIVWILDTETIDRNFMRV